MSDLRDQSQNDCHEDISPPPSKRRKPSSRGRPTTFVATDTSRPHITASPIQLTRVRDLPDSENIDTISLDDLLSDPLIVECWQFNFLFDVDFILSHFDPDVRSTVKLKVVHGSWRREDRNGQAINEALKRWPNVEQIKAWLDDPFGTHHSKMMIIFRNDDTAQIIIHTANMIEKDWTNFTQAVWRSPLLPMLTEQPEALGLDGSRAHAMGSGARFKVDLIRYLKSYGHQRTGKLVQKLEHYQFSSIRAALVASCPSKLPETSSNFEMETSWGWPGLKEVLSSIQPAPRHFSSAEPAIHVQVSSIASFGKGDAWLRNFWHALKSQKEPGLLHFDDRLIFPTVREIQDSLDGYSAGSSIHLKIQSEEQKRQLQNMQDVLCHWSSAGVSNIPSNEPSRSAGRQRAAPHIKTYMRFTDRTLRTIDWALVTSANLSRQAWGTKSNNGEVRVSSYEIGVMLWPALFSEQDGRAASECAMVPCFKADTPSFDAAIDLPGVSKIVGFRMPYDLPLLPYSPEERPWSPSGSYTEPDWLGQYWR